MGIEASPEPVAPRAPADTVALPPSPTGAPREPATIDPVASAPNDAGTPALIQRVAAPTAPVVDPSSADEGRSAAETAREPDEAGSQNPGDGEVDVDTLARRVYEDLKRRLAVEWERVQGHAR